MKMKHLAALCLGLAVSGSAFAQEQPQPQPQPQQPERRGGDDNRNRFEEFRQRANDRMRESMGATEEEWKVLLPRIEKVQTLQRNARTTSGFGGLTGFGGGDRGRGGPGGGERRPEGGNTAGGTAAATPEVPAAVQKSRDLQTALANKDVSPDELKAKLQALREARTAAKAELTKAQEELKGIVTIKQEAQLVAMGVLE